MIVFERDIIVLDTSQKHGSNFDEINGFSLTINTITYATLNHNEKILGVATTTAANPQITLYTTEGGFNMVREIYGF